MKKFMHSDEYKESLAKAFKDVREKLLLTVGDSIPSMTDFFDALNYVFGKVASSHEYHPDAHEVYLQYLIFLSGNKIYDLHPNLIHKLNATNIRAVPSEFLRLPFNSIHMKIPKGTISFFNNDGKIIDAEEILISEIPAHTHKAENDYMALKFLVRNSPYFCYFTIQLSEKEVHECVDKTIDSIVEKLGNREGLEDRIKTVTEDAYIEEEHKEEIIKDIVNNEKFTIDKQNQLRRIFEFIMKCILYINGANADVYWYDENSYLEAKMARVKSPKKLKKIKSMMRKSGIFRVGHRITLSREERLMYENIRTGKWKVTTKFIVQGHYRSQPYGEGRQKRKIIFIEPFYKGEDFSEIINKEHIVK